MTAYLLHIHFLPLVVCLAAFLPLGSGRGPRGGESGSRALEEDRQRLRLGDDRQGVHVAAPPGDDVLVQVRGDAGPGDRALVHRG